MLLLVGFCFAQLLELFPSLHFIIKCVGVWLLFGSLLKRVLNSAEGMAIFNYFMAGLLVFSVIPAVGEIMSQLQQM
ncbi:hypothetical protein L4C42_10505 [Vibrio wakamikoensis]|jgi:hypothetical protein|uniref:Uncharacterized protein n=1 Tax=Vibrio chaetopteri TaxID=3016528 RepID=A0AAU8BPN6_9VIBR